MDTLKKEIHEIQAKKRLEEKEDRTKACWLFVLPCLGVVIPVVLDALF